MKRYAMGALWAVSGLALSLGLTVGAYRIGAQGRAELPVATAVPAAAASTQDQGSGGPATSLDEANTAVTPNGPDTTPTLDQGSNAQGGPASTPQGGSGSDNLGSDDSGSSSGGSDNSGSGSDNSGSGSGNSGSGSEDSGSGHGSDDGSDDDHGSDEDGSGHGSDDGPDHT
jgi:hypothetical protein